jgi:hypothetical protein
MIEEVDYSEEPNREFFESFGGESVEWARCLVSSTPPNYEDVKERAEKIGRSLTRKQYEKAIKALGFAR